MRMAGGPLLGIGAAFVLAAGSRAPWKPGPAEDGVLRLTLSARPERIETCRRLSADEQAERPVHMRLTVECQGRSATYRLRVWRDGVMLEDRVLEGSGWRRDRPIHLLRDYPISAGDHQVRIEIRRIEEVSSDSTSDPDVQQSGIDRESREAAERQRLRLEALPVEVTWSRTITVRPREVTLAVWDPHLRVLRTGPF